MSIVDRDPPRRALASHGRTTPRMGSLFGAELLPKGSGRFAGLVFNRPIDEVFSYAVPESLIEQVVPGQRVRVPLGRGNTPTIGYCVSLDDQPPASLHPRKIKTIAETLDDPPLVDSAMLELTHWLSRYYCCAWGQSLEAALPGGVKKRAGTRQRNVLVIVDSICADAAQRELLSPKQLHALKVIESHKRPMTVADLAQAAQCGTGPIAALRQRGFLQMEKERGSLEDLDSVLIPEPGLLELAERGSEAGGESTDRPRLTAEQERAMITLEPALEGDHFEAFLLHGVTGSGKTEIYLRAIEQVVARDREAIVLVPEISLTPQTIRRFRQRFDRVAVLHSHLSDAERHRHWQAIATGRVQVVVGARSAIFAPTRRLGLIIIDEEHETTFKQEITPRYHARDVAVKRAQLTDVPIILGSATPSLESWHNAARGRYTLLSLSRRVRDLPLPHVTPIDLRYQKLRPERGRPPLALSVPMRDAMTRALRSNGQIILLLNRRGFHTFVLCPSCGYVFQCEACDIALTHHRHSKRMLCHTCDAESPLPEVCPSCDHQGLHYGGLGTEQLERQVAELFPEAKVGRMDSDTMRRPGNYERTLSAFRDGEIQILLGTQMIAKGLDFPNVTLVGVVNADTGLHLPDFRASERTFQLLTQVAGRAGRGERPGRVLVQTHTPDAPAIQHALTHDYLSFVADELPHRERAILPPYGRVARILARGAEAEAVDRFLDAVAGLLIRNAPETIQIFGPAPAPITRIRNLFRFHLQIRAPGPQPLQTLLGTVVPQIHPPTGVELAIDVDPVNML